MKMTIIKILYEFEVHGVWDPGMILIEILNA